MVRSLAHSTFVLPFAPRACCGEILSSWLSRVGCRYDLGPAQILGCLDPKPEISASSEIDWRMSRQEKGCLATAARTDIAAVAELDAASTHPRWEKHWFALDSCGRDPWSEQDIYGNEFRWAWCSLCLTREYCQTGQDYIQLSWTLACVGYCHEHKQMLTSRCSCGATRRPIHVVEGSRTRLICRFCERPVAQQVVKEARGPKRLSRAVDLQIAFERDLIAALDGRTPATAWCGPASNEQLLAVVDDIAFAICRRATYGSQPPIEGFSTSYAHTGRFPDLPDMDHKLCALSPFWRANAVAAILSMIGSQDVCKIMSLDLDICRSPALRRLLDWRGSLEWMLRQLALRDIRRLVARSPSWPDEVRARLDAGVAEARKSGHYYD
jgi:hypothetical protein